MRRLCPKRRACGGLKKPERVSGTRLSRWLLFSVQRSLHCMLKLSALFVENTFRLSQNTPFEIDATPGLGPMQPMQNRRRIWRPENSGSVYKGDRGLGAGARRDEIDPDVREPVGPRPDVHGGCGLDSARSPAGSCSATASSMCPASNDRRDFGERKE